MKQGKDDIGDTYVEIDMGEQMMYSSTISYICTIALYGVLIQP